MNGEIQLAAAACVDVPSLFIYLKMCEEDNVSKPPPPPLQLFSTSHIPQSAPLS